MSLSERALVEAAAALVDEAGFDGLTLRSLGTRVGTTGPALYAHFPSKDVLVDRVVDQLFARAAAEWDPPLEWRATLRSFGYFLRDLLLRHETVLRSLQRTPLASVAAQEVVERVLASLSRAGFDEQTSVRAYYSIWAFAIGDASVEHGRAASRAVTGRVEAEQWARTEHELCGPDRERFPLTRASANLLARMVGELSFDWGMDAILEGIAVQSPRSQAGGSR